ncbi:MAG TPA: hypothetical protein VNM37_27235 [Candidatus Dormibacteraeota bacterium]|nr:hypothetical protein [Candidatus Dormibacteraeota bacterium]
MIKYGLLMVLLLAVAPAFGQTPDVQWTDGAFNGRWWQEHSDPMQRYAYLAGMLQGLGAAQPESKLYDLVVPGGLTYGELIKAVDAVYQEPLNGRLPILGALQIVKAKAAGGDPEAIEGLTRIWRKGFSDVKPATPEVTKQ